VYSQQCGYVLADTQSFRDKMRGITSVMKDTQIDAEIGKTRLVEYILAAQTKLTPMQT